MVESHGGVGAGCGGELLGPRSAFCPQAYEERQRHWPRERETLRDDSTAQAQRAQRAQQLLQLQVFQLQQEKRQLQDDFAQLLQEREQLERRCATFEREQRELGPRLEETKWEVGQARRGGERGSKGPAIPLPLQPATPRDPPHPHLREMEDPPLGLPFLGRGRVSSCHHCRCPRVRSSAHIASSVHCLPTSKNRNVACSAPRTF